MSEERSEHVDLPGAIAAGGAVIGLTSLLLWRDPNLFWNDDYELSILPVFADVARSWSEGHLPLLSPYSWVCSNLAGEFQYGTFSAFINAAVVAIWKLPLRFPQQAAALSMAHLYMLGAGSYLLARGRNLGPPLSLMVALVTAANGWIITWGATNWFGALGAFTWLPWVWWGFDRALDLRRSSYRFLWPVPFVYLLVTGGFPYTVLMLGVLSIWRVLQSLGQGMTIRQAWPMTLGGLLGTGLSAPALLALFDYLRGSAREATDVGSHLQWRLPLSALPGFVLPAWTTNWTDFSTRLMPHTAGELACGFVAPVALLFGLSRIGLPILRQIRWELALLGMLLVIAMLPSANVFRWSFRWLPFVHMTLALCAAHILQAYFLRRTRPSIFESPGAVGFIVASMATVAMIVTKATPPTGYLLAAITLGLAVLWVAADSLPLRYQTITRWMPPALTFVALLATYLCIPTNCGVPKYNLSQRLLSPAPLDPQRLYLSAYPSPEHTYRVDRRPGFIGDVVRPGSTSMWSALRLINGYSPIRPAGIAREYNFGIHGEIDSGVAQRLIEAEAGPDGQLAQLGVDGLIVAPEMRLPAPPATEWKVASSSDEGTVYHRRGAPLPHVRSLTSIASRPNEQFVAASVTVRENSRNRVVADVTVPPGDQPALLSFSRAFFPGYRAHAGKAELTVSSHRGLFPIVAVPAGTAAQIVLNYRPRWLTAGLTCAAVCATATAVCVVLAMRRRRAT